MDDARLKQLARELMWARLEQERAAPPGVYGHIPTFFGAETAAARLATHPVWQEAGIVKVVPDSAQQPVRAQALAAGKVVYMAVPKLADAKPFRLLDPATLAVPPAEAAAHETARIVGRRVGVDEMEPVDLVVCGSVAVNPRGVRLGKGAGYSDLEVALLQEVNLIGPRTTIVTTVHPLQVVDEELPETAHDFSVDLIVTPEDIIECGPPRRPRGLYRDQLRPEQIAAIPVLAAAWKK